MMLTRGTTSTSLHWVAPGIASVLLVAVTVTGCARLSHPAAAGAATRRPHVSLMCAKARQVAAQAMGAGAPRLSCQAALRVAEATHPNLFAPAGGATNPAPPGAPPSFLPEPSPEPPAHVREIQTSGDIGQWQVPGTSITALWMDLEAGMTVQVETATLESSPNQGEVIISVINTDDYSGNGTGAIDGYSGGAYPTPTAVGPIALTNVTGSLAGRSLQITFSYPGGTGTFDPETGTFTM